jgi:hypothetical protein
MKFISYYTPNYKEQADRLRSSLNELQLPYCIEEIPNLGSWDKNTHHKPEFILKHLISSDALVWTDADSVIRENPILFYDLDCDIAFHRFKGQELLSGTVYFKNTVSTIRLLLKWMEINLNNPEVFDQKNLDEAIKSVDILKIYDLPPEYCFIFDLSRDYYDARKPVIEHFQASREKR